MFLPRLTGAILTFVYTRTLTPEGYGLYAIVGALQLFLAVVIDMGVPAALIRGYWDRNGDPETAKAYLTSVSSGASLLALAALPFLGLLLFLAWAETGVGGQNVWIFVPLLLTAAFFERQTEVQAAICRVYGRADSYAVGKTVQSIATIVAGIAIVNILHGGVAGTLLALLIGRLAAMVAYEGIMRRTFGLRGGRARWRDLRESLTFGLPLVPYRLAAWLKQPALKPLLASFVPMTSVGMFSLASSVASLPLVISYAVDMALTPLYFKRRTEIGDDFSKKIERFARIYLAVLLPVWLFLILFSPLIVRLFATRRFIGATPACIALLVGVFARSQQPFLQRQIEFLKATWIIPLVTVAGAAITLAATVLLAKDFGIVAVAWVTAATDILTLLGLAAAVRRYERVFYPVWLSLGLTALLTCIALWFEYGTSPTGQAWTLPGKILLVLFVSAVCYAQWIHKERSFIKQIIKG